MTLTDYVTAKRGSKKKIPADIVERWNTRVVPRGLYRLGAPGAAQYLADYGRGIAAPKVVNLALQAEAEGCVEMALGFWRKAYELETGRPAPQDETADAPIAATAPAQKPRSARESATSSELPAYLQAGRVVTMQPVDAPHPREWYVAHDSYWGQPKRDGNRVVVVATTERVAYQSRSTRLRPIPSLEIDAALQQAYLHFGAFVLDGELYYPDANGGEHRTGAQAASVNVELGRGDVQPVARFCIFKALFANGDDLTPHSEERRIHAGAEIGAWLIERAPLSFEIIPTARTAEAKAALVERQRAEGREGEIWVQKDCRYLGGKDVKRFPLVRTKYLQELDVVITALTPTTAQGRPFGAIEVAALDGTPLGAVGTGFDATQMADIRRRHAQEPGRVRVTIATQGFTEGGQIWHGRFVDFAN